jgi:hypothetical protein
VKFHTVEGGGHGEYFGAGGGCGLYADPEVSRLRLAVPARFLGDISRVPLGIKPRDVIACQSAVF